MPRRQEQTSGDEFKGEIWSWIRDAETTQAEREAQASGVGYREGERPDRVEIRADLEGESEAGGGGLELQVVELEWVVAERGEGEAGADIALSDQEAV